MALFYGSKLTGNGQEWKGVEGMKRDVVKALFSKCMGRRCNEVSILKKCGNEVGLEECSKEVSLEKCGEETSLERCNEGFSPEIRKRHLRRRQLAIVAAFLSAAFGGLAFFVTTYEFPMRFDPHRMKVEPFQAVMIPLGDGSAHWNAVDPKIPQESMPKETITLVRMAYYNISGLSQCSRARTLVRDGKEVRVAYYCYTKTLWDDWFLDSDLSEVSESGSSWGGDMFGDKFESVDYEPQMLEIYYLPMRNLFEIDELSDEEFGALRLGESVTLVWSGVV